MFYTFQENVRREAINTIMKLLNLKTKDELLEVLRDLNVLEGNKLPSRPTSDEVCHVIRHT